MRRDRRLVHIALLHHPCLDLRRDLPRGRRDLGPPAIAERQDELPGGVRCRRRHHPPQRTLHHTGQILHPPHHPQTDPVLVQQRLLPLQEPPQQPHQPLDLRNRANPVLDAEGVKRQVLDTDIPAGLNHGPHGFRTLLVPLDPGHPALLRPAAVAVHDDGHMPRDGRFRHFRRAAHRVHPGGGKRFLKGNGHVVNFLHHRHKAGGIASIRFIYSAYSAMRSVLSRFGPTERMPSFTPVILHRYST